jgi:hypothetical protein
MPCFAPKGFFCSDLHTLEQCPESWYCRGGLLQPAKCPDGKWAPAGAAYLAECGNRMETDIAVFVAIIVVFAGLSLCIWAYCDWARMIGSSSSVQRNICVYSIPPDDSVCFKPGYPSSAASSASAFSPGRPPVRYFLIPGAVPPV